ncbi:transcription factor VOZ1-like protein isoform X1 [Tanacetum coccineum]|uniref:Transcription factor VOZ1-like protein isoform X1 n=1 Tax=Tanacetum coccineum TaxID=301880 RepID=A0ABQ4ZJJ0_9ASTR
MGINSRKPYGDKSNRAPRRRSLKRNIQSVCGALDGAVNISGPSGELDGTPTLPDGRDTTKTGSSLGFSSLERLLDEEDDATSGLTPLKADLDPHETGQSASLYEDLIGQYNVDTSGVATVEENLLEITGPPPPSAFLGPKCALWYCPRLAQGGWCPDYCRRLHAGNAQTEGMSGMIPIQWVTICSNASYNIFMMMDDRLLDEEDEATSGLTPLKADIDPNETGQSASLYKDLIGQYNIDTSGVATILIKHAQGGWCPDYCSSLHVVNAQTEGMSGMIPVERLKSIELNDNLLISALSAKTQGKNVGVPECEGAATAKSPWNAPS